MWAAPTPLSPIRFPCSSSRSSGWRSAATNPPRAVAPRLPMWHCRSCIIVSAGARTGGAQRTSSERSVLTPPSALPRAAAPASPTATPSSRTAATPLPAPLNRSRSASATAPPGSAAPSSLRSVHREGSSDSPVPMRSDRKQGSPATSSSATATFIKCHPAAALAPPGRTAGASGATGRGARAAARLGPPAPSAAVTAAVGVRIPGCSCVRSASGLLRRQRRWCGGRGGRGAPNPGGGPAGASPSAAVAEV